MAEEMENCLNQETLLLDLTGTGARRQDRDAVDRAANGGAKAPQGCGKEPMTEAATGETLLR